MFQRWRGRNTEDGECRGNLFKFGERGIFVHGYVRASSRCSLQIRLQDGRALTGRNVFELNFFASAAPENGFSVRRPYVLNPVDIFTKHGH
jgi:hypothetical protein